MDSGPLMRWHYWRTVYGVRRHWQRVNYPMIIAWVGCCVIWGAVAYEIAGLI